MGPIEVAAIIGAASWVPQVTSWITGKVTQPILRVIPSRVPEIGYSGVGPVFNLTCSILVDKKDAIIDRATVTVEHERGQQVHLTWALLTETFSEYRGGRYDQIGKSQLAIALTVSPRLPVDR